MHSYTINYGGSGEYFDNLLHCLVVDNDVKIVTTGGQTSNVHDSIIDTNDGHSASEQFATREEAIQLLYTKAGSPAVSGKSRVTDVPANASYAKAVKWGEDNNICFGYPDISSDTFGVGQLISRQDFALMAHRYAGYLGLGTAFDYGRTDWFDDFKEIDFYAWGAFTWSVQWEVIKTTGNKCYPHGRLTKSELKAGVNQIFNLDEGATYSSRVDGNGTGGTAERPTFYIVSQPKNYSGPVGTTAKFTVEAQGLGLKYQWQTYTSGTWKNSSLPGATTATLLVGVTDSRNGYKFRCIVTDASGITKTSNAATLKVSAPVTLSITTQPKDYTGTVGSTAKFTVAAQGTGLKYQWQTYNSGTWKNSSLPGATTATLSVPVITSRNGYKFRCVVTDYAKKTVTSNAVTLHVTSSAPLSITTQPKSYSGKVGSTATFKVTAQGTGLKYQWQTYKSGKWVNSSLSGSNTATLSVPIIQSRNGYNFRCVITDSANRIVISDKAILRVTS